MNSLRTILLYSCLASVVSGECLADKYKWVTEHTACLDKSGYVTVPRGVSDAMADIILSQHNKHRASVTDATNMQKMVWDEELAQIAQKWADNCEFGHEEDEQRVIPGRYRVGQNVASTYATWSEAIEGWFNETKDFTFGDESRNDFYRVGHYTQLVWATSSKLGCGFTTCSNNVGKLYVCNYGPVGNIVDWSKPYKRQAGAQCSDCLGKCITSGDNKGLCDCGGMTCYNGGTIDLTTCSCTCLQSYHIPSLDCAINCTGAEDHNNCGVQFNKCGDNIPDYCPNMCHLCPYAGVGYVPKEEKAGNNGSSSSHFNNSFAVFLGTLAMVNVLLFQY